jgi:hypothetical protein
MCACRPCEDESNKDKYIVQKTKTRKEDKAL